MSQHLKKILISLLILLSCNLYAQDKIYWTEYPGNRNFKADIDGSNVENIETGSASGLLDVEVDLENGYIYYTGFSSNEIMRARLDGSEATTLYSTGGNRPFGVDIDTVNNRIFWGNWTGNSLSCASLDGLGTVTNLFTSGTVADVEYDPINNYIYWAYANGTAASRGIWRAQVNAGCTGLTGATQIVQLTRPYGITLDVPNNKIYWADSAADKVGVANLDGTAANLDLFNTASPRDAGVPVFNFLTGIDYHNGTLYVNDYGNNRTLTMNASGAGNISHITSTAASRTWGVDVETFKPKVDIEKATNGSDADTVTGPVVSVGSTVTWTYEIENLGNVALKEFIINDDQIGDIFNSTTGLLTGATLLSPTTGINGDYNNNAIVDAGEKWWIRPGEKFIFQYSGTAVIGQYKNKGTLTVKDQCDKEYMDMDLSHYIAGTPKFEVQKKTNNIDADLPTGPIVNVGDTVTWSYEIQNTGNVDLNDIIITDSDIGVIAIPAVGSITGDTDADGILDIGETWIITATGSATLGQYMNTAVVTAKDPNDDSVPTDPAHSDDSHYFGQTPKFEVQKKTNNIDADTAPGPYLTTGSTVTWSYELTNLGNTNLNDIVITDSDIGIVPIPVIGSITGDINNDGILDVGETWIITATGTAIAGQYMNTVLITAEDPNNDPIPTTDNHSDISHYFGTETDIEIEKDTNGFDADSPTGLNVPSINIGDPITWTYKISNPISSNISFLISDITVTDSDLSLTISGPNNDSGIINELEPGETWEYTAAGIAGSGNPYMNIGTLNAIDRSGKTFTKTDLSHYIGKENSCYGNDKDKDGIIDSIDLDDDNDGILDTIEGNLDSDNDGIINSMDLDSDNDGISDLYEAQIGSVILISLNDSNNDGLDDAFGSGLIPVDFDGDGVPDYLDLDSDNDGIDDLIEDQNITDYLPLMEMDMNCNGLDDAFDPQFNPELDGSYDGDNSGFADFRESPLECAVKNIKPSSFDLDQIGNKIFTIVKKSLRTRVNFSKQGICPKITVKQKKRIIKQSEKLYETIWTNAWKLPETHNPCSDAYNSCPLVENSTLFDENYKAMKKQKRIINNVFKKCENKKHKKIKKFKKQSKKLMQELNTIQSNIPDPIRYCQ